MEKIIDNYIEVFEYTTEINLDINKAKRIRNEIEENLNSIGYDLGNKILFKVHYLLALTRYRTRSYNESIEAGLKSLEYANNLNDKYFIARAHALIALNNIVLEEFNNFEKHYLIAEKIYKELEAYEDLTMLDTKTATYMAKRGEPENLIKMYLGKALNYITKFQSVRSAQLYVSIGAVYSIIYGEFEKAIDLYLKALDIAKYYNDISMEMLILYYIGIGYDEIRMRDKAINTLYSILDDKRFLDFTSTRLCVRFDLINSLLEKNADMNSIQELLYECEKEIKKIDYIKQGQYRVQLNLLIVQYNIKTKKENIKDNLDILDEINNFFQDYRDNFIFTYVDYYIEKLYGDIYYQIGEFFNAIEHHKNAVNISKKYRIKYAINAYEALANDYKSLEDYKNAYETIEEVNKLVMNVEHVNLMAKYNNVQKSYEELKREEREREEFFANLSHELKTPINIIYSSIQLMSLFKGKSDEVFKEYYLKHEKSVRINCLRMLKIIKNMIDINKIDCGAIKPKFGNYNLVSLVEEVTMSVLSSVEVKNIYITFDTDEEEMIAKCDPYMIERIILNLLSNAIKFSKENGFIHVSMKKSNDYILVIISDNGIGIPNNMKENIFNKFIQVDRTFKRKNEGSGIGLSLVKSLVDVHNGYIELESMEDVGSEFKIYIPNITINEVEAIDKYDVDIDRVFSELSDIYEL